MPETISEAIGADHKAFDILYDRIKATNDEAEKVQWRNQLTWTIARHAISEELTLYPAMEKHLGEEGVKLSKTDFEQHQAVRLSTTSARALKAHQYPTIIHRLNPTANRSKTNSPSSKT